MVGSGDQPGTGAAGHPDPAPSNPFPCPGGEFFPKIPMGNADEGMLHVRAPQDRDGDGVGDGDGWCPQHRDHQPWPCWSLQGWRTRTGEGRGDGVGRDKGRERSVFELN